MKHKVDSLYERANNGGLPAKVQWTRGQKLALVAVAAPAVLGAIDLLIRIFSG